MPFILTVGFWYLSQYGEDTPVCGASYDKACKTLDYLLQRIYNQTHSTEMSIKTDTHLEFNAYLVVSGLTMSYFH